jgi:hypothetical protein
MELTVTRAWLLPAFLLSTTAFAQDAPNLVPSRDVTATYRVSGAAASRIPGGAPDGVRVAWNASGQRLRAEVVGQPNYALVSLRARVLDIVFSLQRAYFELPIRGGDPQSLLAGTDVRFTRRGPGRVAGLACTEWAVKSRKLDGVGCVTDDGVVLQAQGTFNGEPGEAVATSVSYGNAGPSLSPPPDFFRLAAPSR